MKKNFLYWITLILLTTTIGIAKACPEGYEQRTLQVDVSPVVGHYCPVAVTFCCKWLSEEYKFIISESGWIYTFLSSDCLYTELPDVDVVFSFIEQYILFHLYETCAPDYPPCDDPNHSFLYVEIKRATCKYFKNEYSPPFPGEKPMWKVRIKDCSGGDTKCKSTYKICKDWSVSPPQLQMILIERITENAYCPVGQRPNHLPPDGYTFEEPWETDCFLTLCQ